MKKYILIGSLMITAWINGVNAQITKGGSVKNWEQYSIVYDTVVVNEIVSSAYPSTSKGYFGVSVMSGRGLMATPHDLYYPEDGFEGLSGHDFRRAYQITLGANSNFEEVNKQLHPAIDISSNFELHLQFGTPEYEETIDPTYTVDYGTYYGFGFGYGLNATLKPQYFSKAPSKKFESLFFDVGYRPDITMYSYGETEFTIPSYGGSGFITMDDLGVRADGVFYLGVRYGIVGLKYELCNQLFMLATPEVSVRYNDPSTSFATTIDSKIDYKFSKLSFLIYF